MEHAEKMFLVPSHQLEQLKNPSSGEENIRTAALSSLDADMRNVLQRRDLTEYEKAKQYSALLQKYLTHVKQGESEKGHLTLSLPAAMPAEPTETTTKAHVSSDPDSVYHEVLDSLSVRYKNPAKIVLNKMLQNKSVSSWNEKGAFVYKGETIPGSNMLDLVKGITQIHALPVARTPKGWDVFLKAMAELNIPSTVVGNPGNRTSLDHLKNPSPMTEIKHTPKASRRSSKKQRQSSSVPWLTL